MFVNRNIKSGIVSDMGLFILNFLMSLIAIPLYLRYLSLSDYGTYLSILSLVNLVLLADFGFGLYALVKISGKSEAVIKPIISTLQQWQYIATFVFFVAIVVLFNFEEYIFSFQEKDFEVLTIGLLASFILKTAFSLNDSVLKSRERFLLVNFLASVEAILNLVLNLIFLHLGTPLWIIGVNFFAVTVLILIVKSMVVYRTVGLSHFKPKFNVELNSLKEGWKYTFNFQVMKLSQVSRGALSIFLISRLCGAEYLAIYNISTKIPFYLPSVISKLVLNFLPKLSSSKDHGVINDSLFSDIFYFLLASVSLIYIFNEDFIRIWVGDVKVISSLELFLVMVLVMLRTLSALLGVKFLSNGNFKKLPIIAVLEVCILIVLPYSFSYTSSAESILIALIIGTSISVFYQVKNFDFSRALLFKFTFPALAISIQVYVIFSLKEKIEFILNNMIVSFILSSIVSMAVIAIPYYFYRKRFNDK